MLSKRLGMPKPSASKRTIRRWAKRLTEEIGEELYTNVF